MTTDLERLSNALQRDTSDKILENAIESQKQQIEEALNAGRDYVLGEGSYRVVIKRAG